MRILADCEEGYYGIMGDYIPYYRLSSATLLLQSVQSNSVLKGIKGNIEVFIIMI